MGSSSSATGVRSVRRSRAPRAGSVRALPVSGTSLTPRRRVPLLLPVFRPILHPRLRRQAVLAVTSLAATVLASLPIRAQESLPDLHSDAAPANSIWVDELNLGNARQGWGSTEARQSVDHHSIVLGGVTYPHGVGTHAIARLEIDLHGAATQFRSMVGVDDEKKGQGSVVFRVSVDGKKVAETGVMHGGDQPQLITADLTGAKRLLLTVGDGDDGTTDDHADWAGAQLTLVPGASRKPETVAIADVPPRLKALPDDPQPAIHGARIIGATPSHPFLFAVPATGTRPLTYSAKGLPAGLNLDRNTGIISGALGAAGTSKVELSVSGPSGSAHRGLTIVGGDHKLALTPPLGWNSWNVWGATVDAGKVTAAADQMIADGFLAHGYQFVNIDDGWEAPQRDAAGNIMGNAKFPDMKALCDGVHARGLRIGIYSSPGPKTCGGYVGSYQHEDQDARTYAQWGFDYLKYDWCSYNSIAHGDASLPMLQKPYQLMRSSLDKVDRDIVYSLCQYGRGDVWKWGANPDIAANCWRTHDDIDDVWAGTGGVHGIIEAEAGHERYGGPGHWNDPDMLMVGIVGFGHTHPSRLTPDEQITHISMWCLFAAPLLIGCDLTRLDPFTRAVLTNDEALDIDQDPLGKPAGRVSNDKEGGEVWSRELSDGTRAVGLLNAGPDPQTVTVRWSDIGVSGKQPVRDLWLHEEEGVFDCSYSVVVPSHGTALLKVGRPAVGD